jgi:uncharacterized protein
MKKQVILFAIVLAGSFATAQTEFTGIWEGKINAGVEIRIIFQISYDTSKKVIGTMSVPEQGLKNVSTTVDINGDSIHIGVAQLQSKYSGQLRGDSIIGNFHQSITLPLNFKKVTSVAEKIRPQTPVPPFPYKTEDLVYTNNDKSITYGATITLPQGRGPFPAAILLTGSGQQNRDEEIMGHKPFAIIADHLTRRGIIVLRVDDRGMGQTSGDVFSATTRDFANDALVSLNYLLNRKEVDKSKVGLIGHSEGGMIAQLIAAERKDISFIIMLAAPGKKTLKLMNDQNEAILTKAGLPADYISAYQELYNEILVTILATDNTNAFEKVKVIVDRWIAKTPVNIVVATSGITDEKSKEAFITQFVSQLTNPWFRYFLSYDPSPYIKKISTKVLAVNGSSDIQVLSKQNLAGIESALKKSSAKYYEIKQFPGLNHLFQECKKCTVAEYDELEQSISPALLDYISSWMKKVL